MRHLFLRGAAALLAASVAATAAAQAPTPANPAAVPAAPKGPRRAEFRVGGFMLSGERSYDFADSVRKATGSTKGVEIVMRAPAIGLQIRSLSGTYGKQPQVISADARLLLFPPSFTIFGGVGKRALSSDLNTRVFNMVQVGVSSTVSIGGTGLRTHVSGAVLIGKDAESTATGAAALKETSKGMEGEAAIFYRLPRIPLFLTVGYRTEIFTGKSGSVEAPEEVRGLRIGGGIQFGGH